MDFRKMADFNLALLGKQAWRLVTNPNSLVNKIFKAKYYPKDSFLSAKLGANQSYVWRSIVTSHKLLKSGLTRRVGNNNSINVEHDPLSSCEHDSYIHTVHAALKEFKSHLSCLMIKAAGT